MSDKIEIKNLSAWFGTNKVLKDITFGIKENQITAIMGPSGCGKTTLIRTINRMNDFVDGFHVKGEIILDGTNIFNDHKTDVFELRKRVGMVFQKPNPFPMSIYDNIAYGPGVHGVSNKQELDQIVQESLVKAALWDEVKDRLHASAVSLSGGQQQRLCIARALSVRPGVLLLDEPAAYLDPISAAKIERLLADLKKEVTIVLVTHNVQQAIRVSDCAAFLYLGELVEYGDTARILENPRDKRTEAFITGKIG